ncbi:MAG: LysM peptidoglycan-binding domain-containing protein [Clostridia bacterium]|nr:LysM peptidoglycan-binding domain-containing protein [Clostridia bacterium]
MADVAGGTAKYYVVKKGDTLTKIANRYGVTRTQLMRWNNRITDPDYIQAGWQIRVG